MGSNERHSRFQIPELTDVVANAFFNDVWEVWKKGNVTLIFKKGRKNDKRNYWLVSLISAPEKIMKQILMEAMLRHVEDRKMMLDNQQGFTKGKSCLTNLVVF